MNTAGIVSGNGAEDSRGGRVQLRLCDGSEVQFRLSFNHEAAAEHCCHEMVCSRDHPIRPECLQSTILQLTLSLYHLIYSQSDRTVSINVGLYYITNLHFKWWSKIYSDSTPNTCLFIYQSKKTNISYKNMTILTINVL